MNNEIYKKIVYTLLVVFCICFCILIINNKRNNDLTLGIESKKTLSILSTYESKSYKDALKVMADEYSNISGNPIIEIKNIPQSDFKKEICIAKDEEKLPDLIICDSSITPALVSMGIFKDISDYMDIKKVSEFLKISYNTTLVMGKSYGVPFTSDPYVLFYNQEYINNNEIKILDTMESFSNALKSINTVGIDKFGFSVKNKEEATSCFLQMNYSFGATIRDLDSDNSKEFYEILKEMRDNKIISSDMINWNQNDLIDKFSQGRVITCALKMSSLSILKSKDIKFKYGITEIPYGKKQSYLYHGENIGVTTNADYEEAIKFIDYITSKEGIKKYTKMIDCLSVRNDYFYNPGETLGLDDSWIQKQKEISKKKSSFASWFMISDTISNNLINFLGNTSITVDEISKKMKDNVKEAIMER